MGTKDSAKKPQACKKLAAFFICAMPLLALSSQIYPGAITKEKAQSILDNYIKAETNTEAGRRRIMWLIGNLPASKGNVKAIRALLSKRLSAEEMGLLLRVLGDMRDARDASGANDEILRELKLQMGNSDRSIATSALFAIPEAATTRITSP